MVSGQHAPTSGLRLWAIRGYRVVRSVVRLERWRLSRQNIIVLDLETAKSADDCWHCGQGREAHTNLTADFLLRSTQAVLSCGKGNTTVFEPLGWGNKATLGLSIGCYYDYSDSRMHWFDAHTLEETLTHFVQTQPLLVSFNGIAFDFPLMCDILRLGADAMNSPGHGGDAQSYAARLCALCDTFKDLYAASYDILAEIWRADPARKFTRWLNSLYAIAQANGLGGKLSHGAEAPRRWARGEHAHVLNYCQDDVLKTKALFEQIVETGVIKRGDGLLIGLSAPCWTTGEVVDLPGMLHFKSS